MRELGLYISASSEGKLKVVWGEGVRLYRAYEVDRDSICGVAQEIRCCLERMKGLWLSTGTDYAASLRELARKGAVLHDLLFPADASENHPSKLAESCLLYDKEQEGISERIDLTVTSDGSVHVPWGLVYRGNPRQIRQGTSAIEDYSGFWCRLFCMRTLFSDRDPLPRRVAPQRDKFRLLFIYDHEEWLQIQDQLNEAERHYLQEGLWKYEVGTATDWDQGQDLWDRMEPNEGILYIFGHSNGTAFSLTRDDRLDTITPAEFRSRFRKKSRTPAICFLNGCWSAVGVGKNSFLNVATTGGFQGFIGAEAPVPNLFAIRYSVAFMHLLCEAGLAVQEAFDLMLQRLWPMSLLYSSYADPAFQVARSPLPLQFPLEVGAQLETPYA